MPRYVYAPGYAMVLTPQDVDFYMRVNTGAFEVTKCKGGWKPIDKSRWLGNLPIKAPLFKKKQ